MTDNQPESSTNCEIPVVYLNNIFQSHTVALQILNTQKEKPSIIEPTPEQLEKLKKFNFQRIDPSETEVEMPAYLSSTDIQLLQLAREAKNDNDKLLYAYAAIQTSPQLFDAINQLLPQKLKFPHFQNFLKSPIVDFNGNKKVMQLSPIYIKERPMNVQSMFYSGFSCDPDKNIKCSMQTGDYCLRSNTYLLQPKLSFKNQIVNIAILSQSDELIFKQIMQEYKQVQPKSTYFDQRRIEAGRNFVNLVKQFPDTKLMTLFQRVMDAQTEKQINLFQLQLVVTMLFFDKLDIIYQFSIMQKCAQLNERENLTFGWPTVYPCENQLKAIALMMFKIDEIWQNYVKQSRPNIVTEVYQSTYLTAKRGIESQINQFSNIKIVNNNNQNIYQVQSSNFQNIENTFQVTSSSQEKLKIFVENGVKVVELKVQQNGFFAVKIPLELYEKGINADIFSTEYKALFQFIQEQIGSKTKARHVKKEKVLQSEDTEVEPSQSKNLLKTREFIDIRPKTSNRIDVQYLVLQLVKAGKLNTLTIFDLDSFYDICFQVCTSDNVGYPCFQFQEYCQKASFGQQESIIRAGRSVYAVLLRYFFAEKELVTKYNILKCNTQINGKSEKLSCQSIVGQKIEQRDITYITSSQLKDLIDSKITISELIQQTIDCSKEYNVSEGAKQLLECTEHCHHCTCDYKGVACIGRCGYQLDLQVVEPTNGLLLCPDLYDHKGKALNPGFALLTAENIFNDSEDLKSYLSSSTHNPIVVSEFCRPKKMQYACQVLQLIDMAFNISQDLVQDSYYINNRIIFGNFLSSRGVDITYFKQKLTNKFQEYQTIYERAKSVPQQIEAKHIEALTKDYNENNIIAELFRTCMQDLDYRIMPCYYCWDYPLCSMFSPSAVSVTYQPLLFQNLQSPEDIKLIVQQEIIDKEIFVYPPSKEETNPDYEPEVDPSVLKKENVIVKLRTITQNYKIQPEEMQEIHRRQHPEQFDLGVYEIDPYYVPKNFDETRQLANSVLNRGKYFTIPFGSEAQHISNEIILDQDIDDSNYSESKRSKYSQTAQKSQYLKYTQPTGAEARVCHIEEEQLCFGLFAVRSACLLRILTEWMAIYTPTLLKYFSYNITTTVAQASPEVCQHYRYRSHLDQNLSNKMNSYFYTNLYKYYREDIDELSDENSTDDDQISPFSTDFDKEIKEISRRYQKYAEICGTDDTLAETYALELPDEWVNKQAYAPVYPWLLENNGQIIATPPPPLLPGILQLHLTQIYTTGQILQDLLQYPLITIPIIARTIQHMLSENQLAEQRAATCWRLLYPESYYKSIDHASVTLGQFDKKFTQTKCFQQDVSRRIKDAEAAVNPNSLDSCIDICLPKVYDHVYFNRYLEHEKKQLTVNLALQYDSRLKFYESFVPSSQIRMYFKFSVLDQLSEILRLGEQNLIASDWQQVALKLTQRMSQNCAGQFDQFDSEQQKSDISNGVSTKDEVLQVLSYFTQANYSILLPQKQFDELMQFNLKKFAMEPAFDIESLKSDKKTCDPQQMIYIEDVTEDLNKQNFKQTDNSKQFYSESNSKQIITNLKQLTTDSQELHSHYRQLFEKAVEQNSIIPSLFDESREIKSTYQFYTKYRHISFPVCSLRSVYLLRSVEFQESLDEDIFEQLMENKLSYNQIRKYCQQAVEKQKADMLQQIVQSTQPKQSAQQKLPQFQQEMCRKLLFDDVIIPLLVRQQDTFIRYIDQDILSTIRFFHIICTRLEYSLKALEIPNKARFAAVYGTRSMHPFPYNFTSAMNIGSSLFGIDVKQHLEQQLKSTKQIQESIFSQCSQKIFYGHQPYINLMNTQDTSVCGCRCQQLKCTFCGGIGAGYNGTLSGSINTKTTTPVELTTSLTNGIFNYPTQQIYEWDDLQNIGKLQFNNVPSQISLLYKMPFVVPHYKYEDLIFQTEEEFKSYRRSRKGSRSESSEEETDITPEKLSYIKYSQIAQSQEYFVPYYGCRIIDSTLFLPQMPAYLQKYESNDIFFKAWMHFSDTYANIQQLHENAKELTLPEVLNADPSILAIDDIALSAQKLNMDNFEEFQFRNLMISSSNKPEFRLFYQLFIQVLQQKDDELTTEVYSLLGGYAYPFLTLKKLMQTAFKRIEQFSFKLINHHFDIASFQLFKSSKNGSSLTTTFLLFALWEQQQIQPISGCLPFYFSKEILKLLKDGDDEIYICENYDGFLNVQALLIESK